MARIGVGQSLVELGWVAEGIAQLENVMLLVIAGEVNPSVSGIAYCTVIGACTAVFRPERALRADEGLEPMVRGAAGPRPVPGSVPRASRSDHAVAWSSCRTPWSRSTRPAPGCRGLPGHPAVGEAYYEQAEVYRLRGDLSQAEEREPCPRRRVRPRGPAGAGDDSAGARAARMPRRPRIPVRSRRSPVARCDPPWSAAAVEIAIAAGDLNAAESAAVELSTIAGRARLV